MTEERLEKLESLVKKIADHLGLETDGERVGIDACFREVSSHYDIPLRDLRSHTRVRTITRARQVAMYIAHLLGSREMAYSRIGLAMGGRDHTTVLHAIRRIAALRHLDSEMNEDIDAITYKLLKKASDDAKISSPLPSRREGDAGSQPLPQHDVGAAAPAPRRHVFRFGR